MRRTGDVQPRRVGGDKRSGRIEAHACVILAAVEEKPDITLAELRELLMSQGVGVRADLDVQLRGLLKPYARFSGLGIAMC